MILSRQLVPPFNQFPIPSISIEIFEKLATEQNTKKIIQEIDLIQSEKLHARELNDSELVLKVDIDDDDEDNKTCDVLDN